MSEIPVKVTKEEFAINFDTLLNKFDFQKVHDIMELLDWQWSMRDENNEYVLKVPGIIDMQRSCSRLFESAMESDYCVDPKEIASGGFTLMVSSDGDICLEFIPVYSTYMYECQEVI